MGLDTEDLLGDFPPPESGFRCLFTNGTLVGAPLAKIVIDLDQRYSQVLAALCELQSWRDRPRGMLFEVPPSFKIEWIEPIYENEGSLVRRLQPVFHGD